MKHETQPVEEVKTFRVQHKVNAPLKELGAIASDFFLAGILGAPAKGKFFFLEIVAQSNKIEIRGNEHQRAMVDHVNVTWQDLTS